MILDKIVQTKKEQLADEKYNLSLRSMVEKANNISRPVFDLSDALYKKNEVTIIAEVKKASPSKGVISKDFNPLGIAKIYEESGASAISVLTEKHYFQGSDDYLQSIREIVRLPLLRKDFIIDEYQIYQAKVIGADAILLIAAILSKSQISEYLDIAKSLGMKALVEVHNEIELKTVLDTDANIIGINNRNLKDFTVSLDTTKELVSYIPSGIIKVSESGISSYDDIKTLKDSGLNAV